MQPAAGDIGQNGDLAHHRRQARAAQPLFHRPQQISIARGLGQQKPRRIKTVRNKAGAVKIRPRQAPQDRGGGCRDKPGDQAGGKSGGERAILLIAAGAKNFVQGAARQTAARQDPVDRRDPERHHAMRRHGRPLDPPHPLTQSVQSFVRHTGRHPNHVSFLF